ncbi:MAG: hypothetical protein WBC73_05360 [Phormidesmis sp.]
MKRFKLAGLALSLVFLTSLLTGCDRFSQVPPNQAVKLAIAHQLTKTQQALAQDLGLATTATGESKPNFKIDALVVQSREKLTDPTFQQDRYPSDLYRVRGTYQAHLTAPSLRSTQSEQPDTPFDLYLGTNPQPDSEGDVETWFLVEPPV